MRHREALEGRQGRRFWSRETQMHRLHSTERLPPQQCVQGPAQSDRRRFVTYQTSVVTEGQLWRCALKPSWSSHGRYVLRRRSRLCRLRCEGVLLIPEVERYAILLAYLGASSEGQTTCRLGGIVCKVHDAAVWPSIGLHTTTVPVSRMPMCAQRKSRALRAVHCATGD